MAIPTTRTEFIEYCLRQLGHPVIPVSMQPEQIEDCVDEQLTWAQKYSLFGSEKTYFAHQISEQDKKNDYLIMPDSITYVIRAFALSGEGSQASPYGTGYSIPGFGFIGDVTTSWGYIGSIAGNLSYSVQVRQFLNELNTHSNMRSRPVRYNLHTRRVFLDSTEGFIKVGNYAMLEAWCLLDPDAWTRMWNDTFFKRYATQLLKRQWGTNLKLFEGMQMPGGTTFNGQKIYDEAAEEIEKIEDDILKSRWGHTPGLRTG